jgi:predicted hydrocarbon binding protein
VHGVIFAGLRKYAEAKIGPQGWATLRKEAGLEDRIYLAVRSYDDADALALVAAASRVTGNAPEAILEDFGKFLAPELLRMYNAIIDPTWKTLDVLEQLESTIHRVVRMRGQNLSPPNLSCARVGSRVSIPYRSERKLCALAVGLIKGIAQGYGEDVSVVEPQCMLRGSTACRLVVDLVTTTA